MAEAYEIYQSALSKRYASKEMSNNFGDLKKFSTWRKLWVYLAKAEKVSAFLSIMRLYLYNLIKP